MSHVYSRKGGNEEGEDSRSVLPVNKTTAHVVNGIPVSGEDYLLLVR